MAAKRKAKGGAAASQTAADSQTASVNTSPNAAYYADLTEALKDLELSCAAFNDTHDMRLFGPLIMRS